jgi:hypothetical protein
MEKIMDKQIPLNEAENEVELASRRIALLHLAFSRMLVAEFGEKRGGKLIAKAIKEYGRMVGTEVRTAVGDQGLPLTPENYGVGSARRLPRIGMHEGVEEVEIAGEKRMRAFGCVMARVWKAYGEEKLGRFYCYVDPAKYMAYNPKFKLTHVKALPDGDDYCEFCIRETSQQEQDDFQSDDSDWLYIDKC